MGLDLGLKVEVVSVYDLERLISDYNDGVEVSEDEDDDEAETNVVRIGEPAPVESSDYSSEYMGRRDMMDLFFSKTRRLERGTVWVRKPDNYALQVRMWGR